MSSKVTSVTQSNPDWLVGGGEMGARMRALDWSQTPLGPMETWSPTLKTMTRFLLVNRFPILLWWGPQFCQLYNDAYRPILGTKHPQFLGRPTAECWSEIWDILRPLIETPFHGGPATWMEDIQLELNRYGFTEETHFTIAYSPVPDETVESGIGGVVATVHEISEKSWANAASLCSEISAPVRSRRRVLKRLATWPPTPSRAIRKTSPSRCSI